MEREIGLLTFFFSNGPEELYRESTHNHQVEQKLALTTGTVNMLCYYSVNLGSTIDRSKDSSMISLDIQGRSIYILFFTLYNVFVHPGTVSMSVFIYFFPFQSWRSNPILKSTQQHMSLKEIS